MQFKTCSKCHRELPLTEKYFFKCKRNKDGFAGTCKECSGHKFITHYKSKSEFKICNKCGRKLPATEEYFHKKKGTYDGLHSICKECRLSKYKDEYYKNQEKMRERNRIRGIKYKKAILENKKKYYAQNRAKILEYKKEYYDNNRKEILKYKSRYGKENKEKLKIRNHRRDAEKQKLEHNFTKKEWEECKKHFEYKCAYCGEKLLLTQEHFIALHNGGEYTKNNIIPACRSCNSSKQDKDFFVWYPKQKFYNKNRELKILKYLNYNKSTKLQQLALII